MFSVRVAALEAVWALTALSSLAAYPAPICQSKKLQGWGS